MTRMHVRNRKLLALAALFAAMLAAPSARPAAAALPPPVACFTATCDGLTCDFDATCADSQGGNYVWIWGDGSHTEATEKTASHTYKNGGIFTVRLTVGFDRVGFDSKTQRVTVSEPGS